MKKATKRNMGNIRLVKHDQNDEGNITITLLEDAPSFETTRDAEKYIKDSISVGDNLSIIRVVKTYTAAERVSKVVTGHSPNEEEQLDLWR